MTERESAHPSSHQLCDLTTAAVNGIRPAESPLLPQSQPIIMDSVDNARKGDGEEEPPRSKSLVS